MQRSMLKTKSTISSECTLFSFAFRMQTPLHCAAEKAHLDSVELLLKSGAKVSTCDGSGQTALHKAAHEGLVQVCRVLLANGAETAIVSSDGYTAAQLAPETVQKLFLEPPGDVTDTDQQLLEASKAGDLEALRIRRKTVSTLFNVLFLETLHSSECEL
eukprot:m.290670 g.290670  ORF g.290670 m.290670 type:complete len:159 (+) comp40720_c2_seq10:709-1185(+)